MVLDEVVSHHGRYGPSLYFVRMGLRAVAKWQLGPGQAIRGKESLGPRLAAGLILEKIFLSGASCRLRFPSLPESPTFLEGIFITSSLPWRFPSPRS